MVSPVVVLLEDRRSGSDNRRAPEAGAGPQPQAARRDRSGRNRFGFLLSPTYRARHAGRCRVAHAVAELHMVSGRAVLVDIDTLELTILGYPQVPRAGDLLDQPEHDERESTDD